MKLEQVVRDVEQALEALSLGSEPRRGTLSGFDSSLYAALSILAAPGSPGLRSRCELLTRWRELLSSMRAENAAIRHFGTVHGPGVDPARLWRNVLAAISTATAAQLARLAEVDAQARHTVMTHIVDASRLLSAQGGQPVGLADPVVAHTARQLVLEACRALRDAGWEMRAAEMWILRWLGDSPEPDSMARVAMVDVRSQEGFIGDLHFYRIAKSSESQLVVDPASSLLPIGRSFLATLHEAWEHAGSPPLAWSLAVPGGAEAAVLDGNSASGAVRVAIEALGSELADPSTLVLAKATRRGDLIHDDITRMGDKLRAARQAGITRIVTGVGAPQITEPGLKVVTAETVRIAVDFITSREPFVRINRKFPAFQDFFGMESELEELLRQAESSPIIVLHGLSGAGKTYLAAALADRLAEAKWRVVWLEQEGMGLSEFMAEAQRVFTDDQYIGSIVGEADAPDKHKLIRLVEAMAKHHVALFIEDFQRAKRDELVPLLEQCAKYGEGSLVILLDHEPPVGWLGSQPVVSRHVSGFSPADARRYLREHSSTQWSDAQLTAVYRLTDGHALALWAVRQWIEARYEVEDVMAHLLDYDAACRRELERKLIRGVSERLRPVESEALHRASVFRVPFGRSAWACLGVEPDVGRDLENRGRLAVTATGDLRIHPLVRRHCYQAMADPRPWHAAAGRYYLDLPAGVASSGSEVADRLEAHYHFLRAGDQVAALHAAELAIRAAHENEPLASGRLRPLEPWLIGIPLEELAGRPWLLIEQGRLLAAQGNQSAARLAFLAVTEGSRSEPRPGSHGSGSVTVAGHEPAVLCMAHYWLGKLQLAAADPQAALSELEEALGNTRSEPRMRLRILGKMVDCLTNLEQYDQAKATADELLATADDDTDKLGSALTLYRTGRIERHRAHFREAADYFDRSASMFAALHDNYRRAKALTRAGIAFTHLGRLRDAEDRLNQAIALKKKIGDFHGLARDTDYLADIYLMQGRYADARDRYADSMRRKEGAATSDDYGKIKTYNNLGRLNAMTGDLLEARTALEQSAELMGAVRGAPLWRPVRLTGRQRALLVGVEGTRLVNTGDWYLARGQYRDAIRAYRNAVPRLSRPAPVVPYALARVVLGLGVASAALGDFGGAIRHLAGARLDDLAREYKRSAPTSDRQGSPTPLSRSSGRGPHLRDMSALAIARLHGFHVIEAYAVTHIARLAAQVGRLDLARELSESASTIAGRIGSRQLEMACSVSRGIVAECQSMISASRADFDSVEALSTVRSFYDAATAGFGAMGAKRESADAEVRRRLWRLTEKVLTAYQTSHGRIGSEEPRHDSRPGAATEKLIIDSPIDETSAFGELVSDLPRYAIETALLRSLGIIGNLASISPPLATQYARQALHVMAPIAAQLGHPDWRALIEQKAFAYLLPAELQRICQEAQLDRPWRAGLLRRVVTELRVAVNSPAEHKAVSDGLPRTSSERTQGLLHALPQDWSCGPRWEVKARLKSPFSIFRKQLVMSVRIHDIFDIVGVRVITDTEADCREVKDIVMRLGEPFGGRGLLSNEIRDYISLPKPSGYKSIHINRKFGPANWSVVEFQIRTRDMNLHAEVGLAGLGLNIDPSHARYKTSSPRYKPRNASDDRQQRQTANPAFEQQLTIVCHRDDLRLIGRALTQFKTLDVHSVDLSLPAVSVDGSSVLILHLFVRAVAKDAQGHLEKLIQQVMEKLEPHAVEILAPGEQRPTEAKLSNEQKAHLLLDLAASFPDSIYTVTPKGDVRRLPRGATVLDFAYAVHTEIGHRATRALVNDRLVSFDHELRPGDVVEIHTKATEAGPSQDWLKIVRTKHARKKIKQWFARERREDALEAGRDDFRRAMRKRGVARSTATNDALARAAKAAHEKSVEALYVAIGERRRSATQVVEDLLREAAAHSADEQKAAQRSRGSRRR